jgi:hypothetical protein
MAGSTAGTELVVVPALEQARGLGGDLRLAWREGGHLSTWLRTSG